MTMKQAYTTYKVGIITYKNKKSTAKTTKKKSTPKKKEQNKVKISPTIQAGSGPGYNLSSAELNVGNYSSNNYIIKNNKMSCSVSSTKIIGNISYEQVKPISCNHAEIIHEQFEKTISITYGYVTLSQKNIFIGIDKGLYFEAGGHIKIGIEIEW